MLIKFIARGTGSAAAAAAYLTRETDSQGKERADVSVLRGDPDQVAAVADALEFEQKYTSAVIAWAPEDSRATRRSPGCSTSSRTRPGPVWRRIATRGRRCGTVRRGAAFTCMWSRRGVTWRRARA